MQNDYKKQVLATASTLRNESDFINLVESAKFSKEETKAEIFKVINELKKVTNLSVVIFPKSFAFRVGGSKRNVIPSRPQGVNGEILNQRQFLELITKLKRQSISFTKNEFNSVVLLYFLLFKPNIVKYGEDTTLRAETATISQTENKLRSIIGEQEYLSIQIGTEKYFVDSFKKISGVPKADAAFYYKNQPVIFVSLKNGGSPGNFQQYGGWPTDLGIRSRSDLEKQENKSLEKFVLRVENIFKSLGLKPDTSGSFNFNNLKKGNNFAEYLDDGKLAAKVVYGKDYGTKIFGKNNVQIVLDGDIIFKPLNGSYTIEGSFKTSINPMIAKNTPNFKVDPTDLYAPVLLLAKSESQGLNQAGFKNVRAYVFPNNKVSKTYLEKTKKIEEILKRNDKNEIARLKQEITK